MRVKDPSALRDAIKARDLSHRELALIVGRCRQAIGHLTTGVRTTCTPELADQIAHALRVDVGVLFDAKGATSGSADRKRDTA